MKSQTRIDTSETNVMKANSIDPRQWVAAHSDYLYSYVITRINDEEQARDLLQETFLAALERLDKFEGKSSERTWLTAILKNKIIDVYRKKSSGGEKKIQAFDGLYEQDNFFNASDGHWKEEHQPQPFGIEEDDPLASKEFNLILRKCMQKLPALWLSVFTMKHIDDLPTDTICNELRVTPSNFWVIIHRAKVNLRSCLQRNWI